MSEQFTFGGKSYYKPHGMRSELSPEEAAHNLSQLEFCEKDSALLAKVPVDFDVCHAIHQSLVALKFDTESQVLTDFSPMYLRATFSGGNVNHIPAFALQMPGSYEGLELVFNPIGAKKLERGGIKNDALQNFCEKNSHERGLRLT